MLLNLPSQFVHIFPTQVNNAGEYYAGSFETLTPRDLDEMLAVNLKSHVAVTQRALPHLLQHAGEDHGAKSGPGGGTQASHGNHACDCNRLHTNVTPVLCKSLRGKWDKVIWGFLVRLWSNVIHYALLEHFALSLPARPFQTDSTKGWFLAGCIVNNSSEVGVRPVSSIFHCEFEAETHHKRHKCKHKSVPFRRLLCR